MVVRQSWGIERGSPASGGGVRQLDLKVALVEEDGRGSQMSLFVNGPLPCREVLCPMNL